MDSDNSFSISCQFVLKDKDLFSLKAIVIDFSSVESISSCNSEKAPSSAFLTKKLFETPFLAAGCYRFKLIVKP